MFGLKSSHLHNHLQGVTNEGDTLLWRGLVEEAEQQDRGPKHTERQQPKQFNGLATEWSEWSN